MNKTQMIQFLGAQVLFVSEQIMTANKTGDRTKVLACLDKVKPRIEYLKGYAAAMEHAGFLDKASADQLFSAFADI